MADESQKNLLDITETKQQILKKLESVTERIVVISAFVSNAIDWIEPLCPIGLEKVLITRGRFQDFQSGSSKIEDIRKAYEAGWKVGFENSLHAKIYLFDSAAIIVGSSNFTVNGLALYGNKGNIEYSYASKATENDVEIVEKLVRTATPLSTKLLEQMQDNLRNNGARELWPLQPTISPGPLFVSDMLWQSPLHDKKKTEDLNHDLDILGISSIDKDILSEALLETKVIHWLIKTVREAEDSECYFGYLSKILHTEIGKESKVYRKEIKQFVRILFDYISYSQLSIFVIDRPNYSERIRLTHE